MPTCLWHISRRGLRVFSSAVHCTSATGAPISQTRWIISPTCCDTARRLGLRMIALRLLIAMSALKMKVATGCVADARPTTTPTGLAISTIRCLLSKLIGLSGFSLELRGVPRPATAFLSVLPGRCPCRFPPPSRRPAPERVRRARPGPEAADRSVLAPALDLPLCVSSDSRARRRSKCDQRAGYDRVP